jgi:hypothetical protein
MGWTVHCTLGVTNGSNNDHGRQGDKFVVNGQRLKVFLEPDVIHVYILDGDPDRQA